jgi:hypothetical protein
MQKLSTLEEEGNFKIKVHGRVSLETVALYISFLTDAATSVCSSFIRCFQRDLYLCLH